MVGSGLGLVLLSGQLLLFIPTSPHSVSNAAGLGQLILGLSLYQKTEKLLQINTESFSYIPKLFSHPQPNFWQKIQTIHYNYKSKFQVFEL